MKVFITEIEAVDPIDGQIKKWEGPRIVEKNIKEAKKYCQENGLGYCKVIGELIEDIESNQLIFDFNNIKLDISDE